MNSLAIFGGKKTINKNLLNLPEIQKEEKERVMKVLDKGVLSGFVAKKGDSFLGGEQVRELEKNICDYFQIKHSVSVNSATAGLYIALASCGIGPGDEVIVTPYTMSASATAILMQNAIPVFVDIRRDTLCIDERLLEEKVTSATKAIVVVHLFGYPAEMDKILQIADKYNLYVVEDCAQAPGALYKNRYVGTLGNIGVFSFNQHKTITCGEGGFCITNNKDLALRMQLIRNHGEVVVNDMKISDITNIIGYNYRLTEIEAAISIEQFKRLDFLNEQRRKLASYLSTRLSKYDFFLLPKEEKGNKHVYFVYPIIVDWMKMGISRDIFIKAITAEGIPFVSGYVKPIYLEPLYQKKIAYGKHGCPFNCKFYKKDIFYPKRLCPVAEKMYFNDLILTGICRHPNTIEDMELTVQAIEKVIANKTSLKKLQ